jgi:two-component system chemotaxis response regulator CheY
VSLGDVPLQANWAFSLERFFTKQSKSDADGKGYCLMAKSLLIVDDSATMRKIILRTIRMSGLNFDQTEEAGNGLEALEKLKACHIDVMLCDINMPEMNGAELVKKAREMPNCAGTKIIMVSTESSQEIVEKLLKEGADGFITKPFTPEKFHEKITPLLN